MKNLGLKEELEIEIVNIQSKKITEGKEFSRNDLYELSNIGATIETIEIPAKGEYKDYYFEIDENNVVTILDKAYGQKPFIEAQIVSTDLKTVAEIRVTASISEGEIKNIEAINGAILKEDSNNTNTEKTFTVNKDSIYYFKVTADNGRSAIKAVNVNIFEEPKITITNVTPLGFTVTVNNNYPDGLIKEYKCYANGELVSNGIKEKSFKITGLYEGTKYNVYVEVCTEFGEIRSNVETVTTTIINRGIKLNGGTDIYTNLNQGTIFPDSSGQYTVAIRVKINRQEQASINYMGLFGYHVSGDGIQIQFAGTTSNISLLGDYTPYYDKWTDIVLTYNNGTRKEYINSIFKGHMFSASRPYYDFVIGNSWVFDGNPRHMKGEIASIKVWSKELTENEIYELDMGQENTDIQVDYLKLESFLDSLEEIQRIGRFQGSNYKFLGEE